MKNVLNYINEALRIKSGIKNITTQKYIFTPQTFDDLVNYINDKINSLDENATVLDIKQIDCKNLTSLEHLSTKAFKHIIKYKNLKKVDVSGWNVATIENLSYTFINCEVINEFIGLNTWDVSKVNNINGLFKSCFNLTELDLTGWDLPNLGNNSKVKECTMVFMNCYKLKTIKGIENWDFSKFTALSSVFAICNSLENINVSNWKLPKGSGGILIKGITNIFTSCRNLKKLDLSKWDVSKITSLKSLFSSCKSLETVGDISGWDVSSAINIEDMFYSCENLTLDISKWKLHPSVFKSRAFYKTNRKIFKKPKQ